MKKRMLALALALALTLTPALGADLTDTFPKKADYPGFVDMPESHWAYAGVKLCAERQLLYGVGDNRFNPAGVMDAASAAGIAARLGAAFAGETVAPAGNGEAWYAPAWAYVQKTATDGKNQALLNKMGSDPTVDCTRDLFFSMLAAMVPDSALTAKNAITALPDNTDGGILKLYNAGILSGVDDYGTFAGQKTLTRAEMAIAVARILNPELALTFTPKVKPTATTYTLPGATSTDPAITGKTLTVNLQDFLTAYVESVEEIKLFCKEQNVDFRWDLTFDTGDTTASLAHKTATSVSLSRLWMGVDHTPYTAELLGAKHILVATQMEADDLRAELKAAGDSETLFDELMNKRSTDGGLKANPNGYVFGPGEMITEFEAGAKALAVGQISQPIESKYGYHIIYRFQPTADQLTSVGYSRWVVDQDFRYSDAVMEADLTLFYDSL